MKCSNCNKEIPDKSKICPNCGTILANFFEDIVLSKKQRILLFLHKYSFYGLLILLVFIFFIVIIIKHNKRVNIVRESNYIESDSLYKSTNKYYKYILSSKEKKIYDIIFDSINNYIEYVTIDLDDYGIDIDRFNYETLTNIKHVLSMDHPELINFGGINIDEKDNNIVKLIINYSIPYERLNSASSELIDKIEFLKSSSNNMILYEKIKFIRDYFNSNIEITDLKDTKYFSAYCIVLGKCSNTGVSKAIQLVFSKLNIDTTLVVGSKNNKYYEWNIVKIDDKYYNYDVDKFLFSDKNYILYHKEVLPNPNGKKYLTK